MAHQIATMAPALSNIPKTGKHAVAIQCEVTMRGARLVIESSGADCTTDGYRSVIELMLGVVPSEVAYVVTDAPESPYGQGFWGFEKIEQKKGPRPNPHQQTGQLGEVEIAGIRVSVPLGIKWKPQTSVVSKKLLKYSEIILARVGDLYFGMYTKTGSFVGLSNGTYVANIECVEDYVYLVDILCEQTKRMPAPMLLRGYAGSRQRKLPAPTCPVTSSAGGELCRRPLQKERER